MMFDLSLQLNRLVHLLIIKHRSCPDFVDNIFWTYYHQLRRSRVLPTDASYATRKAFDGNRVTFAKRACQSQHCVLLRVSKSITQMLKSSRRNVVTSKEPHCHKLYFRFL